MADSQKRLWLIGGTSESAVLAQAIAAQNFFCTITVTTPEAVKLYPASPYLRVRVGQLTETQIEAFIAQEQIIAIIDASHPYAIAISQTVIQIAERLQIPYLRYERAEVRPKTNVIELDSFETLLRGNYLADQRVLLTVGCKALPQFNQWQSQATLFARILPNLDSLKIALESGFTPDRLIAIRPPISVELETALWQQWNISLVVSKASGQAGGEEIKQLVSHQLGIPLILITRPKINYPQQTNNLDEILNFCCVYYSH